MTDCSAVHFATVKRRPVTVFTHVKVVVLSLVGGAMGIVGAFFGELQTGGAILLIVIGAPVIEEAFKPVGVYLALLRWPEALTSRFYRASLCALAGVVYAPDAPDWFPLFRFTIPVMLHAVASFTVGLGIDRRLGEWVNHGTRLPKRTRNFYFLGVAIHAAYNTAAVGLALGGVFE